MGSFIKKYVTDFIAGVVGTATMLTGTYAVASPGALTDIQGSTTEIIIALIAAFLGGGLSALNTKIQTKRSS